MQNLAQRSKALTAGLLAAFFWGASFVAIRIVLRFLQPVSLVFLRFLLEVMVLMLLGLKRAELRCPGRDEIPRLALLGSIGVTGHQ